VEGKQAGIDPDLVRLLARTPIGVTYAGGVRSLDDLDRIADLGAERVDATIGSALDLFGGTLSYDDVLAWHRRHAAH
jgi:phosphoribosylformimino-5-aminoimidazole carboxamide ribotide isomerase